MKHIIPILLISILFTACQDVKSDTNNSTEKTNKKVTSQKQADNENQVNLEKFKNKFESGNKEASVKVAYIYQEAFKDYKNAILWYKKGVDLKVKGAGHNLALLYETEFRDYKNAIKYYKIDSALGTIKATYNLAYLYDLTLKDTQKAIIWYTKAASLGDKDAAYNLGNIYTKYKNMIDFNEAIIWYKKAAALGDKESAFNVAWINKHKFKNYDEALIWYKKAADMGDLGGKKFYKELLEKGSL